MTQMINYRPRLSSEEQDAYAVQLLRFVAGFPTETVFTGAIGNTRVTIDLCGLVEALDDGRALVVRRAAVEQFAKSVRRMAHDLTKSRRDLVRGALDRRCFELLQGYENADSTSVSQ